MLVTDAVVEAVRGSARTYAFEGIGEVKLKFFHEYTRFENLARGMG